MSKRVAKQINSFKYKGEPIRITVGTLVLTALCVLLIIVATFTQLTLKHPYLPLDTLSFLAVETDEHAILHHFTAHRCRSRESGHRAGSGSSGRPCAPCPSCTRRSRWT